MQLFQLKLNRPNDKIKTKEVIIKIMKQNKILKLFFGATVALSAIFTSNYLQKSRISQTLSSNSNQTNLISNLDNLNSEVQYILSTVNNETNIFLDDYYSSLYFSNLVDNFGNNTHGTCSYVAIGMLLSFYDSYWNDNLIPESYDKVSNYQYVISPTYDFEYPSFDVLSPGIESEQWDDVFELTESEYLTFVNQNESIYFQSKLIKLSQLYFGMAKFESSTNPYGMTFGEILGFLDYYLYDYRGLTTSNFYIDSENTNSNLVRSFAISKITDGAPVLLRVSSPTLGCHALVAYDYDSYNDEIYVHPGWMDDDGNSLTHVSLSSLGFNNIVDAISLESNSSHVHSNNYHSSRNINVCSCMYSFPQNVSIASGNYRDMAPTFKWKSLYNEKWFEQYNPYFKLSILNSNQTTFLTINNISQKEYTLSSTDWENILYNLFGNTYYCYLELASNTYSYWDDYFYLKSFTKPLEYNQLPQIKPNEYGFVDAYPSDDWTKDTFVSHTASHNFAFETRRYRTGYIHDEYIVMSPIRNGYKEAYIEYRFSYAVTRIDVELAHWRPTSHEWLTSSTGEASIQYYWENQWVDKLDLLSSSTALPTNRNSHKFYKILFDNPVYRVRFHAETFSSNTNDSNRGRICIGNMAFYPSEYNLPLSGGELDYEPSNWNNSNVNKYNCYAYALNTKQHGYMQPGGSEGHNSSNTANYLTASVLINMVILDSTNYNFVFNPISKSAKCPVGQYKVALVIAPNTDYHWYRQNSDGTWSHKPGPENVIKIDYQDEIIYDPAFADRRYDYSGYYTVNYTQWVGYFAVSEAH